MPTAATYINLDIAEMISLLFCSYFSLINSLSAHHAHLSLITVDMLLAKIENETGYLAKCKHQACDPYYKKPRTKAG